MVILAIETTGPLASCAILRDGHISKKTNNTDYSHLREIAPMVQELMLEEGLFGDEIDAVAVSRGPGSFTGLRIGMAAAKAMAQVWNKPVIEVPTLYSFAYGDYEWLRDKGRILICPFFDARRGQVYAAACEPGNRKPVIEEGAYDLEEVIAMIESRAAAYDGFAFFGDGSDAFKEKLDKVAKPHIFAPESCRYQHASSIARLADRLFEIGELKDCYTSKPEYLRPAEAERKLREKLSREK